VRWLWLCVTQKGSEHGDAHDAEWLSRPTTRAGCSGGISTRVRIVRVSMAIKPTSSIRVPRQSIDIRRQPADCRNLWSSRPLRGHPRHADCRGHAGPGPDRPCTCSHRAQCGDVAGATRRPFAAPASLNPLTGWRSLTDSTRTLIQGAVLDQLDLVAVGVGDEGDQGVAALDGTGFARDSRHRGLRPLVAHRVAQRRRCRRPRWRCGRRRCPARSCLTP
jgi:hypothetical protein